MLLGLFCGFLMFMFIYTDFLADRLSVAIVYCPIVTMVIY